MCVAVCVCVCVHQIIRYVHLTRKRTYLYYPEHGQMFQVKPTKMLVCHYDSEIWIIKSVLVGICIIFSLQLLKTLTLKTLYVLIKKRMQWVNLNTTVWMGNLDFYVKTKYLATCIKIIFPQSSLENVAIIDSMWLSICIIILFTNSFK